MQGAAESNVLALAEASKLASAELALSSTQLRQRALLAIAEALELNAEKIAAANEIDLANCKKRVENGELKDSLFQRLKFDRAKILSTTQGIRQIAAMPEPLGVSTLARQLDEDLELYKISSSIGVVAVIFEARPEAMPQILALCLKTANAVLLKGGSEAERTNRLLFEIMQSAASAAGVPQAAFALLETRADVKQLLNADAFVDLIIPRGSNELVRSIQENTRIPVLGHAAGICHVYVDKTADLKMAEEVILDSKCQYPSACNAVETVLIHKDVLERILPALCAALQKRAVELRVDECCLQSLEKITNAEHDFDFDLLKAANENDWKEEYGELILSLKAVSSMQEAIEHINKFGSGHTEAMIAQDRTRFERFFRAVNSAGIYLNASTRFADGYRYGFGAELGISTSKMHPRGPVGIEGLLSYKYKILGKGHLVADYSGTNAKVFLHKDLS
ncbi:MAG: glutamate-5-semialdehyde dehydrogenase [Candidatus Obscuribacterales bacterium]|nr:glutamate-5-semialdehyde dehydrogenase [Candidatus Obscuribacterales bacterium]